MKNEIVTFDRDPNNYKHWELLIEGSRATIFLDVAENEGIRPGYELKLNSYDLGVDIELNDIIQRIRFEQPQVKVVVITSKQEKNFSAGANIYMLGMSEHSWKVNFCKFTNETRNGFEDSSNSGSLKFIAAVNGICAGGGDDGKGVALLHVKLNPSRSSCDVIVKGSGRDLANKLLSSVVKSVSKVK